MKGADLDKWEEVEGEVLGQALGDEGDELVVVEQAEVGELGAVGGVEWAGGGEGGDGFGVEARANCWE